MDHLEFWVIGLTIIPIIIFKYVQLRNASQETNNSIKEYLTLKYNRWNFISELLIYSGLMGFLLLVVSNIENTEAPFLPIIYSCTIAFVIIGVSILVINNLSKFKPSELKQQILSEQQLEKKVANSKKALYFFYAGPILIGCFVIIEFAYPINDGTFMGFEITDMPLWKILSVVAIWIIIYALMVACAFCLRKMSKHMLNGNLYGKEPIKYLSISANLLQIMAIVLIFYSFFEGILTEDLDVSFVLKPIFWLAYFLMFMSLMLKYLSHVLQRAAILKEENDLTI